MKFFFAASLLATAAGCATVQDGPPQAAGRVAAAPKPPEPHANYGAWPSQPMVVPEPRLQTDPVGNNMVRNLEGPNNGGAPERGGR
jgi:hypothetical protein